MSSISGLTVLFHEMPACYSACPGCLFNHPTKGCNCENEINRSRPRAAIFVEENLAVSETGGGSICRFLRPHNQLSRTTGVVITNSTGHGGTTNYIASDIVSGAVVSLRAPLTSGEKDFNGWSGCDGTAATADSICSMTMSSNKTATPAFVVKPDDVFTDSFEDDL